MFNIFSQQMRGLLLLCVVGVALGCSNILVSKGASADGYTHVSYNADDAALFGALPRWAAADHEADAMRDVYSWDLGIYLGSIPEAAHTLNVFGNANEKGVVIGETTHGGLEVLSNFGKDSRNGTVIDYGSLIWLTLQRASTAREAIDVMVDLCTEYGYASDMEGFSIADKNEVWYVELLGRGNYEKGVLYVAVRIPEGYVAAHANQARITDEFLNCDDPAWCKCSRDIVEFATKYGFYDPGGGEPFSFSGVFDPVTFEGARFCEARVWYVFSQVSSDFDAEYYLPYAQGRDLSRRMPLYVKASNPVSRDQMHTLMSSHYENSWFDPAVDVGAGPEHTPYRWNDLSWDYEDATYVNERIVGTQYTGWHFVATVRDDGNLPDPARAVLWWGADDHSFSPKIPVHGGASQIHPGYDDMDCTGRSVCRRDRGLPGTVTDFSFDSAWWLSNLVADVAYTRMDRAKPVILKAKAELEAEFESQLEELDLELQVRKTKSNTIADLLSTHAVDVSTKALQTWQQLWQQLMVSFIDGKVTVDNPDDHVCGCSKQSARFSDEWKQKYLADTGDKYLEEEASNAGGENIATLLRGAEMATERAAATKKFKSRPKLSIKGV